MDSNIPDNNKKVFRAERRDRFWTGIALLIVGGVLLADKWGVDFPRWLFQWPSIVVLVGLVSGFKSNFRNSSWFIITLVGVIFMADAIDTDLNFREYLWPIVILAFGVMFIMRPRKRWCRNRKAWDGVSYTHVNPSTDAGLPASNYDASKTYNPTSGFGAEHEYSSADVIESVSIFGGVKKVVTSKNFQGGEVICFMGGAEYNLMQADFTGHIVIEVIQGFGGTKFIIPPHWEVRSEAVAIFAGFEDKRPLQPGAFDPNKVLIIKGTSIFGGIEIKSF